MLDEEEALEELEELDKDGDSQLKWQEYLESHFSYTQDELKDMRKEDSEDNEELLKVSTAYTVQSTLVISTSLISNNRISRSENLIPVSTQRSTNRQQNILEKRRNCSSFPQYFQYISNLGVKLHIHSAKGGRSINYFPQFRKSDVSKYGCLEVFIESLGFRDNKRLLYLS